jgi:hypothetical protein
MARLFVSDVAKFLYVKNGNLQNIPVFVAIVVATTVIDLHMHKGIAPEYDIYAGREVRDHRPPHEIRYPASKWQNPFRVEIFPAQAMVMFEYYARALISEVPWDEFKQRKFPDLSTSQCKTLKYEYLKTLDKYGFTFDLRELVGKRVACWCCRQKWYETGLCHVDIWIKLIHEAGLEN